MSLSGSHLGEIDESNMYAVLPLLVITKRLFPLIIDVNHHFNLT